MTNDEARKSNEALILPEQAGDNSASVIRASALIRHSGFVMPNLTALIVAKGFTYLERTYILQASCRCVLQNEADETLFANRHGTARL